MERISAKALAAQLRLLVDYIVHEVSNNPQLVNTVCLVCVCVVCVCACVCV